MDFQYATFPVHGDIWDYPKILPVVDYISTQFLDRFFRGISNIKKHQERLASRVSSGVLRDSCRFVDQNSIASLQYDQEISLLTRENAIELDENFSYNRKNKEIRHLNGDIYRKPFEVKNSPYLSITPVFRGYYELSDFQQFCRDVGEFAMQFSNYEGIRVETKKLPERISEKTSRKVERMNHDSREIFQSLIDLQKEIPEHDSYLIKFDKTKYFIRRGIVPLSLFLDARY